MGDEVEYLLHENIPNGMISIAYHCIHFISFYFIYLWLTESMGSVLMNPSSMSLRPGTSLDASFKMSLHRILYLAAVVTTSVIMLVPDR